MTEAIPSTTVRGDEDTVNWQVFERKNGPGLGELRIEVAVPREVIPYLGRGRQYAIKGRPNFTTLVEGKALELAVTRPAAGRGDEATLPEDDESKLLSTRKEELRIDCARKTAELAALNAQHQHALAAHARDIDRLGGLFHQENTRLTNERVRVDAAIATYNSELTKKEEELTRKQKNLLRLADLEDELISSFQVRISSADDDLQERLESKKSQNEAIQRRLDAAHKEGKQRIGEKVLEYVKESAPPGEIAGLFKLITAKLARKSGLLDMLKDD